MTKTLVEIVEALTVPGEREVGSEGHEIARSFLIREMKGRGLEGYAGRGFEHRYRAAGCEIRNLLGVIPSADGTASRPEPVLLAAHYDTCGEQPGADDNAAAVAILLSLVERIREARLGRPVILAFFDAEEPPFYLSEAMGSTWWYEHQRVETIHCAIVLDLVGHPVPIPTLEDLLFVTGMESDPGLEGVFRTAASPARVVRVVPTLTRYIGDMSDYRAFRLAQRPYLFLSCGQWEHYHRPTDTPDRLDYEKMSGVADFLFDALVAVARTELRGPFEGYDTTRTEIEFLRAAAGPFLESLGMQVTSREEIDRVVEHLMSFGLL